MMSASSSAPPHAVPRVRLGMVGADAGPVKGILKPSRAWAPAAGDDASDEDARRRALAAGKAPEQPPRRDEDTATTATYARFHDRVGAVFANLGPGLTTPGVSNAARPDPPAWMPANTSVFRRGRDVPDRDDDDDDDDSEPDPDDDALEPAHRDPSDGAGPSDDPRRWDDDLDCLRSDDDDDEGGGGVDDDGAGANPSDVGGKDAHLRRSVGRCVALNREDEYDAYDAVAMTGGRVDITTVAADGRVGGRLEAFANAPDDEEAALRPDSVVVERGDSDDSDDDDDDYRGVTDGARPERSGGTRRARATLAPYVPPAKRAKRGVTWAPAAAGVSPGVSDPATTRATAPASAPRRRARGHRVGNSWVPDHVKHPERYTCYTLDEPLIIGGGLSGNGSRAKARGGAGDSVAVRAAASRGGDAAATASPSTDRVEGEKHEQMPEPIVFRPSAAAAAKRRRSGAVDAAAAAAAATGTGCVSFARHDDEDDGGAGGGEEELVVGAGGGGRARGGSARGNQRRFRRKAASEDEDE